MIWKRIWLGRSSSHDTKTVCVSNRTDSNEFPVGLSAVSALDLRLLSSLDKFQVVHDKQQLAAGPGGSFGYGSGGRRMVRGGAHFPASFVWCRHQTAYFFILIKKMFFRRLQTRDEWWWTCWLRKLFCRQTLIAHLHRDNSWKNEKAIAFVSHLSRLVLVSTLRQSNQWTCSANNEEFTFFIIRKRASDKQTESSERRSIFLCSFNSDVKRERCWKNWLTQESIYHYSVHRSHGILSFSWHNDAHCRQGQSWRMDQSELLYSLHVKTRDKLRLERALILL